MKKISSIVIVVWLAVVGAAFFMNVSTLRKGHTDLVFQTARAFFEQIVLARSWNAGHGGVYVPITETTTPNPYLDDLLRDLETDKGISLTKINPAFMTRQIAEIAVQESGVQFHITSLKPVRPENKSTDWESKWLKLFEQGRKEQGEFVRDDAGVSMFRYMAPLLTKKSCLKCHAKHGYKEGDIRGGISVTLPFFSKPDYLPLVYGYGTAALLGVLVIFISGLLLERSKNQLVLANQHLSDEIEVRKIAEEEQQVLIVDLQKALSEIKILQGIIPICAQCKQIRDDQGAWSQMESYIKQHSEAEFSHGLCPHCYKKIKDETDRLFKPQ